MYKAKVHSRRSNDSNVSWNVKKVYVGSMQKPFKKDITIIEVALYTKYIDTELVYLSICGELRRT